jgi:hypothetical protein
MSNPARPAAADRRLWWAYAGACVLAWLLHILAGMDFQRGSWQAWEAVYEATWTTWPAVLAGAAVWPWVRWLQRRRLSAPALVGCHVVAALVFGLMWQALEYAAAFWLFGAAHARAVLLQTLLSRQIVGVLVYAGIASSFTAVLQSRRARAGAIAAAQAEAALAQAELAAISGKLNPHFLFNTLNVVIALVRKDPRSAEQALLQFSGMLRYVLATKRDAADRVLLEDELEFVRNYLALESQRLGSRLQVEWDVDPRTLQHEIPPLTVQPLVENSVLHGVAPRAKGGTVRIRSRHDPEADALHLSIEDDGPGCDPARVNAPEAGRTGGVGLSALKRRFALDYGGQARLHIATAPGAGFKVELWIPRFAS